MFVQGARQGTESVRGVAFDKLALQLFQCRRLGPTRRGHSKIGAPLPSKALTASRSGRMRQPKAKERSSRRGALRYNSVAFTSVCSPHGIQARQGSSGGAARYFRSVAIFCETRNGVRPISGAKNQATAMAFGGPRSSCVRPGAHSARRQDSRNDLTPCRMALHFVSAGTRAPHSDETPGPTATRASSHSARRLRSLAFLCSSQAFPRRCRRAAPILKEGSSRGDRPTQSAPTPSL